MSNKNNSRGCAAGAQTAPYRAAEYRQVLEQWWPRGAPFPPAFPWVGAMTSRRQLARSIDALGASLPPIPPDVRGDQLATLEFISDLSIRMGDASGSGIAVSMCLGGKEPDEQRGEFMSTFGGECDHSGYNSGPCVSIGDGTDYPGTGSCQTGCARVQTYPDCSYDIQECCEESECDCPEGVEC